MVAEGRLWSREFVYLCFLQLLMTVAFYSTMPMIALFLERRLGLSGPILGAVVVSATVAAILARLVSGWVLDAYGRRVVYLGAFSLFAGLYFLYAFAAGAWSAGALRFGHGLAWGAGMTATTTMAVDITPEDRRGEGIGYFTLVMMVSMAIGPALGMAVLNAKDFDFLFRMAGGLGLAGLVGGLFLRYPKITLTAQPLSWDGVFEQNALRLGAVVFFLTLPYGCFMNYGAMYATDALSASAGWFYAIFAASTGLSRVFSGREYDRHGPARVLNAACLLLFVGLLAMSVSKNHLLFYGATVLCGLADGMGLPVLIAMVNDLVPAERRGKANGCLMTFFELGICGGVVSTSLLYRSVSWTAAYLVLAGGVVLALGTWRFVALPHYLSRVENAQKRAEGI